MRRKSFTTAAVLAVLTVFLAWGAGPALAATGTWALLTTPNPPTMTELNAVSCVSASNCTAVGYGVQSGAAGTQALAEHWNGTAWSNQSSAATAGGASELRGVTCLSSTNCQAVGYSNTFAGPVHLHWNGTAWSLEDGQTGPSGGSLGSVSCASADNCLAVGETSSGPLSQQWDGTSWTTLTTPQPSGEVGSLDGVSCTSSTSCTAAGTGTTSSGTEKPLAERWNGSTWSIMTTVKPSGGGSFSGISCSSSAACTAVGGTGSSSTLAERWNGSTWAVQSTPSVADSLLDAVSCPSATECMSVGVKNDSSSGYTTLAQFWNGSSWVTQSTPNPSGSNADDMLGVACPATSYCMAAGFYSGASVPGNFQALAEEWAS